MSMYYTDISKFFLSMFHTIYQHSNTESISIMNTIIYSNTIIAMYVFVVWGVSIYKLPNHIMISHHVW